MTAAELHVVDETELDKVEHWRAEELIRDAGYEPRQRNNWYELLS